MSCASASGLAVALQPRASLDPAGMLPWLGAGLGTGLAPEAKGDLSSLLFVSSVRQLIIQEARRSAVELEVPASNPLLVIKGNSISAAPALLPAL